MSLQEPTGMSEPSSQEGQDDMAIKNTAQEELGGRRSDDTDARFRAASEANRAAAINLARISQAANKADQKRGADNARLAIAAARAADARRRGDVA